MAGCGATDEQHIVLGKRIFFTVLRFLCRVGVAPPLVPFISIELHS